MGSEAALCGIYAATSRSGPSRRSVFPGRAGQRKFKNMTRPLKIPGIGKIPDDSGMPRLQECSDAVFTVGQNGVVSITATGDGKVEFIAFEDRTLAYVKSAMGYPAYYPVHAAKVEWPIEAVLMDLDGTSVRSEDFWTWVIEQTIATLLGDSKFELLSEDGPYVSGHSVSEHLQYCIEKYCPERTVEEARNHYFQITCREMAKILSGKGRSDAFVPSPGLKEFLVRLKEEGVKIGLVTSGLYEKAWPEIVSAFRTMGMGDPKDFYDAIITAGFQPRQGQAGTLGELSPKPHPWLYAEIARVGLGLEPAKRARVLGLEDSGAGVVSIRLAGFAAIGIEGGNIEASGVGPLVYKRCRDLADALDVILGQ